MPSAPASALRALRAHHGARSSQPLALEIFVGTGTRSCPGAARKHLLSVRVGRLQLISALTHQHPAYERGWAQDPSGPPDGFVVLVQPQDRQGPEANQPCTRMRSVQALALSAGLEPTLRRIWRRKALDPTAVDLTGYPSSPCDPRTGASSCPYGQPGQQRLSKGSLREDVSTKGHARRCWLANTKTFMREAPIWVSRNGCRLN